MKYHIIFEIFFSSGQPDILKQRSKRSRSFLRLRHLVRLFLNLDCSNILECLHAQTDFSVFDRDDFYFYFLAFFENSTRMLDALVADLRDMNKSAQTVSEVNECAVRHQGFYGSLGDKADLNVRNALLEVLCFLLTQDFFCGEHKLLILRICSDDAHLDFLSNPLIRIFNVS